MFTHSSMMNSSISSNSIEMIFHKSFVFTDIWPIDKTLSGSATPDQSRPGSDDNEGVLSIPQSSSITRASPSDCLES